MITVGEYLAESQPYTLWLLLRRYGITMASLKRPTPVIEDRPFIWWDRLMREKPKVGVRA